MSNESGGIRYKSKWKNGGKEPKHTPLEFDFTTQELQEYVRSKITQVNDALSRNNVSITKVDPAQVHVRAMDVGKRFVPLLVLLPKEVLRLQTANVPEMFQNEQDNVPMQQVYWELLRRFMYPKKEVEDIRSRRMQGLLGIRDHDSVEEFIRFSTPKSIKNRNQQGTLVITSVCIILNPMPMMHDMLIDKFHPNDRFDLSVVDIKVFGDSNSAIYSVSRQVKKRGGGRGFRRKVEEIERAING